MSRFVLGFLSKAGVLAVIFQVADTNQVAPFHAEMMMHGRQPGAFARLLDLEPGSRPRLVGGPQTVDVDADARADLAGPPPPVAQKNRHRSLGLARHDPGRKLHGFAAITQLDDVFVLDTEPLCQGRAEERGIVPGQLGQGLGQFLEPAVIGPAAVTDRRVGAEEDLETLRTSVSPAAPGW